MMKKFLRYQLSLYDCGLCSWENAIIFLLDRDNIKPELIKIIENYTLDDNNGYNGTSREGIRGICDNINFMSIGIYCLYRDGIDVKIDDIRDCLKRDGVVIYRTYQEGEHYVLITDIDDCYVYIWDSFYLDNNYYDNDCMVEMIDNDNYNRKVRIGRLIASETRDFSLGDVDFRECVLINRV